MDPEGWFIPPNVWLLIMGGSLLFLSRAVLFRHNMRRGAQLCSLLTETPEDC